jgi:predicted nucleic acid-binding protein
MDAQSAGGAWHIYERWRALPEVVLLPEPEGVDLLLADWSQSLSLDSRDWTDAYLAAFAIAGGHRLVAFDQGFRRFAGLDLLQLVA